MARHFSLIFSKICVGKDWNLKQSSACLEIDIRDGKQLKINSSSHADVYISRPKFQYLFKDEYQLK